MGEQRGRCLREWSIKAQGASQRLLDHHDVPAHSYHATAKEFSLYACRLFQQKKQAISIQWNELLDDV
jgi:hypothetical protein